MASLQFRSNSWRILFNYGGAQHAFTIGDVTEVEAVQWKAKTEHLLMRIKQHLLDAPPP